MTRGCKGDPAVARTALRSARLVIFDFDGPITRLLPYPEYRQLAEAALRVVHDAGVAVPAGVAGLTDHGAVLVEVGRRWPDLLGRVEDLSEAAEVAAAGLRDPSPGAIELLQALNAAGTPVALVSNNGGACVRAFLERHGLHALVGDVYGRLTGRADRLKPSPAMLLDAAASAGVPAALSVMVGDNVTDVVAAARAGMPAVGLTSEPGRAGAMREEGAGAVLADTAALAAAFLSG